MVLLYSLTVFLAAFLTFAVQPMVAKTVLPYFGGSSSVWNTCVLFFQTTLLAGYAYAHYTSHWFGNRRQKYVHFGCLLVLILLLPLGIPLWAMPSDSSLAAFRLLAILSAFIGLPFLLVSTTAPLAQRWFSQTEHPHSHDPYFLYAASNFGSMLGLLTYPSIMEPWFTLQYQSYLWSFGYLLLVALLLACAAFPRRADAKSALQRTGDPVVDEPEPKTEVTIPQRLKWIALAFIPSTLMLSVTTYLTTDITPVPFLWVTPLGIYLLTFILAFSRRSFLPQWVTVRIVAAMIPVLLFLHLSDLKDPIFVTISVHLLGLFFLALLLHGELAQSRPSVTRLTEFYLWVALGGMLGGLFCSLVAPFVFDGVTEYPIALVLTALFMNQKGKGERGTPNGLWDCLKNDLAPAVLVGSVAVGLILLLNWYELELGHNLRCGLIFAPPVVFCYVLHERSLRFAMALASVLVVASFEPGLYGKLELSERTFYGIHRVTIDRTETYRILVHGSTIHGQQYLDESRHDVPLTYYHRKGPIGSVFKYLEDTQVEIKKVGVVGLGVGSLASYAKPKQEWTFFEIDPVVYEIARDPKYFTFLSDCPGKVRVILGDARVKLGEEKEDRYDVLVVDAFNSDSLPVHLLTREALQLYRKRLQPNGIIAFHISNRYLNLEPVLFELARDAELLCFAKRDSGSFNIGDEPLGSTWVAHEKSPSHWLIMGSPSSNLDKLAKKKLWSEPQGLDEGQLWTDDFSNVLTIVKWRECLGLEQ